MVDAVSAITLIIGIIGCIIGICTFISGRMARAERNGSMETKITQALEGIESINRKLEASALTQHTIDLTVHSHDEQIKTLFRQYSELRALHTEGDRTREVISDLLQFLRSSHHSEQGVAK